MAGTTISSVSSVGVVISSAAQNPLTITASGTIVTTGSYGVYVALGLLGTIANAGTVISTTGLGVSMQSGGSLVNGSATNRAATISGYRYGVSISDGGAGQVTNYGTIGSLTQVSRDGTGVDIRGQGIVVNGSAADTTALIAGYANGVKFFAAGASVANYGTIRATGTATLSHAATSYGVYMRHGGSVTNGSEADRVATISGVVRGVEIAIGPGTVTNFGTIVGTGTYGRGIALGGGGRVTNGSATDHAAYIGGGNVGIYVNGLTPSTVVNYGTIKVMAATGDIGVKLMAGGSIVNGSAADTTALISGTMRGVFLRGTAPSSVVNYGTIVGGTSNGVQMYQGGSLTNGSEADRTALIAGQPGVYLGGSVASSVANFGTIASNGVGQRAILATAGASIVNGSATDTTATIAGGGDGLCITGGPSLVTNYGTISGNTGVDFTRSGRAAGVTLTGTGTVVNAGTIIGTGGTAIRFGSGTERLVVVPGAVFVGRVVAGTGSDTIELAAGGAGTLVGLGSNFSGFAAVQVDAGARWTLAGASSIAAGAKLTSAGTLNIAAGATLEVAGTLSGGVQSLGAGARLIVDAGASLGGTFAASGDATLELATGSTGTLSALAARGGSVSGGWNFSGFGAIQLDRGATWQINGANTLASGASLAVAGTLTGGATLTAVGSAAVSAGGLLRLGGLVLQGGGVSVSGGGAVEIGTAGGAAGNTVTIDSGATLSGFGTLANPVVDNGTLRATGGTLSTTGKITGTGRVSIGAGATFSAAGAVATAGVTFESGGGETLALGNPAGDTALLSGFGAGDIIDLLGVSANTLSYSVGQLRISKGSTVLSKLSFAGSFTVANFALASDGHGGTAISYVASAVQGLSARSSLSFVDAAAGHQTIDVAAPGGTVATIAGFTLTNGDVLNLRAALAGSTWHGDMTRIGGYVTTHTTAAATTVAVDPTGHAGGSTVAVLNGLQASLADLIAHQSVAFS